MKKIGWIVITIIVLWFVWMGMYRGEWPQQIMTNVVTSFMGPVDGIIFELMMPRTTEERKAELQKEAREREERFGWGTDDSKSQKTEEELEEEIVELIESLWWPWVADQWSSGEDLSQMSFELWYVLPQGRTQDRTYHRGTTAGGRESVLLEKNSYAISILIQAKHPNQGGGGSMLHTLDFEKIDIKTGRGKWNAFWRSSDPYSLDGVGPWTDDKTVYLDLFTIEEVFDEPRLVGTTKYLAKSKMQMDAADFTLTVSYSLPITEQNFKNGNYDLDTFAEMDKIVSSLFR